jgi:hypothetical protein
MRCRFIPLLARILNHKSAIWKSCNYFLTIAEKQTSHLPQLYLTSTSDSLLGRYHCYGNSLIHLFRDGIGRMERLLMNSLVLRSGFPMAKGRSGSAIIVTRNDNGTRYIVALVRIQP